MHTNPQRINLVYDILNEAREAYHMATQNVYETARILGEKEDAELLATVTVDGKEQSKHTGTKAVVEAKIRQACKLQKANHVAALEVQSEARLALDEATQEVERVRLLMRYDEVEYKVRDFSAPR